MTLVQTFVEDLLTLKQIVQQGLTLEKALFDPNKIFSMMRDIFTPQARTRGVNLLIPMTNSAGAMRDGSTETWPLPQLIGDARRFQQVLINLIKNALKFTTKGHILLQARYDVQCSTLMVDVKDTGAGIAASDFAKLFKRWGKLHRTAE